MQMSQLFVAISHICTRFNAEEGALCLDQAPEKLATNFHREDFVAPQEACSEACAARRSVTTSSARLPRAESEAALCEM